MAKLEEKLYPPLNEKFETGEISQEDLNQVVQNLGIGDICLNYEFEYVPHVAHTFTIYSKDDKKIEEKVVCASCVDRNVFYLNHVVQKESRAVGNLDLTKITPGELNYDDLKDRITEFVQNDFESRAIQYEDRKEENGLTIIEKKREFIDEKYGVLSQPRIVYLPRIKLQGNCGEAILDGVDESTISVVRYE